MAVWKDLTKGVKNIAPAKMRWPIIQAVMRSGLNLSTAMRKEAMLRGGRGVKSRLS